MGFRSFFLLDGGDDNEGGDVGFTLIWLIGLTGVRFLVLSTSFMGVWYLSPKPYLGLGSDFLAGSGAAVVAGAGAGAGSGSVTVIDGGVFDVFGLAGCFFGVLGTFRISVGDFGVLGVLDLLGVVDAVGVVGAGTGSGSGLDDDSTSSGTTTGFSTDVPSPLALSALIE